MTLLPGVTHQYSAKLILFQDSVAFRCYGLHLLYKILNLTVRQILRDVLAVFYYVGIRRMSADKINALVRDKVEVPRVTLMNINLSVSAFVLKVNLLPATVKGNIVDIYADYITVKQLGFNKRCASARELVED